MAIRLTQNNTDIRRQTDVLLGRVFSPLCGLSTMIGYVFNSGSDPRFMVAGGEMTNAQILTNQSTQQPLRRGSYHIGASGIFRDEPVIKCIGETVERYSQVISELLRESEIILESYDRLSEVVARKLERTALSFFSEQQYSTPEFPFAPFSESEPLGWLQVESLIDGSRTWAPAQLLFIGYALKRHLGERWINSSVSTGTAAHTSRGLALRNALLELIQIDSVMGHWYGNGDAHRISLDDRVSTISCIIAQRFRYTEAVPSFYWLPNADLPGFTIVCIIRSAHGVPAVAAGIGIDLTLADAMYKALLEAIGVFQLAKLSHVNQNYRPTQDAPVNPTKIYNLDDNVIWYALHSNTGPVERKFGVDNPLPGSSLPPDVAVDLDSELNLLIDAFRGTGKQLFSLDLTSVDIAQLGFSSLRVWSPDTLSLCLPSAPPKRHRRFQAYGGFENDDPHPYP